MGERTLTASLEETEDVSKSHVRRDRATQGDREAQGGPRPQGDSPAIRLLDALRAGDDVGILAVCGETTTASAENMAWSCRGRDEIHEMLTEARRRFPGLTFESRTRHIGFGLVIDEARVQDDLFEAEDDTGNEPETPTTPLTAEETSGPDIHPMWDEPVTEQRNMLSVWRSTPEENQPPTRLNMPVRVTVRHDDLQVHDITLSFPAALLKRALGLRVDPLEMSLSEVQSAFIAPVGAGFTTHVLARPELPLAPPAPPEAETADTEQEPPRRRRRLLVPVLVAVLAVIAAGGWWVVQGKDAADQATPPAVSPSLNAQPSASPSPSVSASPTSAPSSSKSPTVTQGNPTNAPSRKPNVTLRSDLAFAFNSSTLSPQAKKAIDQVAQQVRDAKLQGTIYVDGYTDNLGSAAYGLVLSQRRATAVSNYLKTQLVGVPVDIVSTGHGEADPVKDNSTAAGRIANRRVTITLPKA